MATKELVQAVVTANRARQTRAKELNVRAGSSMFPLLGQSDLETWLQERLGDAGSIGSILDTEVMRLSPLDEDLAELVVRENPDQVQLVGQTFTVAHRSGYAPTVTLESEQVKAQLWRQLPDEGVVLPSGRAVMVAVKFGYYDSVSETSIPVLKQKVREHLNAQQWSGWSTKPELPVPDPNVDESVVLPIVTAQYGTCVVEGTPLVAYGTVAVNRSRYYSSDPWFKGEWYRTEDEASKVREAAVTKLAELKQEAREKREAEQLKVEAEAARQELQGLSGREGWYDLDYDLRSEVDGRRYAYLPSTTSEIRQWIIDTKALVAKVEKATGSLQQQREAEARARAEAERAEREELAVILQENGDNLDSARQIKAFAEVVEEIKGARKGAEILRGELESSYGRARRQDAVSQRVSGLSDTDAGSRFLSFHRANDVDQWLAGAVAWLEAKLQKSKVKSHHDEPPVKGEPVDLSQVTMLFGVPIKRDKKK